ncbi:MAG TPA: anti-sigma factor antagonist [Leptolyngbyaceae cyanobacterium]
MALNTTLETKEGIATITLAGDLDASTANIFKQEVEAAATSNPKRLVLMMQDLNYMASAGLRVLIFAKQKMGTDVDIYIISPQEGVLDTLEKTGYAQSVFVMTLDEYNAQ